MIRQIARRRRLILLLALAFTAVFVYDHVIESPSSDPDSLAELEALIRAIRTEEGFEYSHPLENSCRYPILEPEDPNLHKSIKHGRKITCDKVQVDLVMWDADCGILKVDKKAASALNQTVTCYFQAFTGGVVPNRMDLVPVMRWTQLDDEAKTNHDMVRVECNTTSPPNCVYRFAFSRVSEHKTGFEPSSPQKLSLDILVIDSTALNMFRRHAPSTWDYMVNKMGFFVFDGYMKVGDNSLVNLIPLLSGLRYKNTAPDMPSDLDQPVDSETTPFLWHLFKTKNCVTMFNDDIAHRSRGFMNYPFSETPGFKSQPTHHFYRAWHLYYRRKPIKNSTHFCFGNEPYYKQQLALTRQMIKKYNSTCHFSFNFLTDLTHDDPNMLEVLDEDLLNILKESYEGGHLKNTALVIMGDHGNRINLIRYSYIGRIEERMPLFALYLPEAFRRANPEIIRNLKINQHRLVSHFDAHEMFRDILEENFAGQISTRSAIRPRHGISLFRSIPVDRTCADANIPLNFCVCMVQNRTLGTSPDENLLRAWMKDLLLQWFIDKFSQQVVRCPAQPSIVLTNISAWTTNQYVQHGVKNMSDTKQMKNVQQQWRRGETEYFDVQFAVNSLAIRGIAQVQHNKKLKALTLTLDPLVHVNKKTSMKRCSL